MSKMTNVFIIKEAIDWNKLQKNSPNNQFSPDFPTFKADIERRLDAVLGPNWKGLIDGALGQGASDRLIKEFWDKNWSDRETYEELAVIFDRIQDGEQPYPSMVPGSVDTRRNKRPMDIKDFDQDFVDPYGSPDQFDGETSDDDVEDL